MIPEYSLSTSTVTSSNGSTTVVPSCASFVTIFGGEMTSSYPSRRICSIKIPSCSSPRAYTVVFSPSASDFLIVSVTLLSVSAMRRLLIFDGVTSCPSWPAKGPLLAPNSMESVGGASGGVDSAFLTGFDALVSVSPTAIESGTPAKVTTSPA